MYVSRALIACKALAVARMDSVDGKVGATNGADAGVIYAYFTSGSW